MLQNKVIGNAINAEKSLKREKKFSLKELTKLRFIIRSVGRNY